MNNEELILEGILESISKVEKKITNNWSIPIDCFTLIVNNNGEMKEVEYDGGVILPDSINHRIKILKFGFGERIRIYDSELNRWYI